MRRETLGRGGAPLCEGGTRVRGGSRSVGKEGNPSVERKVYSLVGRGTLGSEVRDPTVERSTRDQKWKVEASWEGGSCWEEASG